MQVSLSSTRSNFSWDLAAASKSSEPLLQATHRLTCTSEGAGAKLSPAPEKPGLCVCVSLCVSPPPLCLSPPPPCDTHIVRVCGEGSSLAILSLSLCCCCCCSSHGCGRGERAIAAAVSPQLGQRDADGPAVFPGQQPKSRRIINLGPVMLIPEEQPAQPAIPVQPEGTRVVCGHCGNTFLWMELRFNTLAKCPHCKKISSVGCALPRRRCCAYITIGMIFIFIGVGLTVGTQDFARNFHATYVSWAIAYLLGLVCLIRACYWGAIKVSYPEHSFA
uniref:type 2 phosphatidylinositol 4,5-bisphosphate 4-phosphatase isoform X1 n=1 Tax=Podarcis muralis TaxID=64176 RepID=UPI0010A09718|nr:type 2 phosphatidylinositol 4,5-bisphosphate 4-phosphatase isoform X1 [Podarcis muralis]